MNVRNTLVVLGVLVLAAMLAVLTSPPLGAQQGHSPTDVTITGPLPLPITGSTSVSGTITANQGGPWSVGIQGTPSVSIANPNNQPVPVSDVEKMARIPYESTVRMTTCNGNGAGCIFYFTAPPSGFRLVAENLSGFFMVSPSTTVPLVGYLEDNGPGSFKIRTAFTAPIGQVNLGNWAQAAFSQPVKFYFDASEGTPLAVASSGWITGGSSEMTLTGYLENCSITGCPAVQQ